MRSLPDEFYRATARLIRIAEKAGVPPDQCEDVAQEALLHALEHCKDVPAEYSLAQIRSWPAEIGYHRAVDALRVRARHSSLSLDELRAEPMEAPSANGENRLAWIDALHEILARLEDEDAQNYRLVCERYLESQSIKELVQATGRNANEIRCRIYRALEKLRTWGVECRPDSEVVP